MSYYDKRYIKYLLVMASKGREFACLGGAGVAFRGFEVKCMHNLDTALNFVNWEKNKPNLYLSVAKYKNIPRFTFNPKDRRKETSKWFSSNSSDITAFDLFFDFDLGEGDTWESLIKEVNSLREYLEEYNVPYQVWFSGNKGVQVVIDGDYLKIDKIDRGNIYPHKTIVENIKEALNLKTLDLSNNGEKSKLRKLPYSLVIPNQKGIPKEEFLKIPENQMNVCLPLTNEQIEKFKLDDMKTVSVLNKVNLTNRGTLERFSELNLMEKKQNVAEFIKMFDF